MTSPINLLLVDDRHENLMVLETLLGGPGIELLKAESGRAALELLLQYEVALALIDVQMPEMDGFELAELMRGAKRTARVPIIFITAGMHERNREFRGYDAGAVDFLFKPVQPRVLRNKVQVFVDLYNQRKELESTLRLNEELVAIVSHDLRNPLNSIATANELLKAGPDADTSRMVSGRIQKSIVRMTAIIDDLLDLSRARLGGGIPVSPTACDLVALARAAVDELLGPEGDHQLVQLSHEGDLRGEWDPARLEQVLSNLIGNALRHGEPGHAVRVHLAGGDASGVMATVNNVGCIPASALPTLFEPFASPNSSAGRGEGLGLGLYIVAQIISAHHGRISVSSEPEHGTTFTVELPRR